jgi:hypothetical protein
MASAQSRAGFTFVVARYDEIQMEGERPYDARKGNIIKGRKWKETRGGNGPEPGVVQRIVYPLGQGRVRARGQLKVKIMFKADQKFKFSDPWKF